MASIKLQDLLDVWFPGRQRVSVDTLLKAIGLAKYRYVELTLAGESGSGKSLLSKICRKASEKQSLDVKVHYGQYGELGPDLNICETTTGPTRQEAYTLNLCKPPNPRTFDESEIEALAQELLDYSL